jgi:hypothetical protein
VGKQESSTVADPAIGPELEAGGLADLIIGGAVRKVQEITVLGTLLSAVLVDRPDDCPSEGWAICVEERGLLRRTPSGTIVGVFPFLYTWGLCRGVDDSGYRERWCYHSLAEAVANAAMLRDDDEPVGFIRKATA